MNIEDYKKIETQICDSHKLELHKLRAEYVKKIGNIILYYG